ncbi:hypothetical protein D3C87_816150 [compost metagenome]
MQGRHDRRHGHVRKPLTAAALAALFALAAAGPAKAWTVEQREETYGIGIRWQEGQWSGNLVVPTSNSVVGHDKVQHAMAGALIATAFRLTGAEASTALGAAMLAGTMKEIGDSGRIPGVPRGHMELGDWVATSLGGLLAVWATQTESRAP